MCIKKKVGTSTKMGPKLQVTFTENSLFPEKENLVLGLKMGPKWGKFTQIH